MATEASPNLSSSWLLDQEDQLSCTIKFKSAAYSIFIFEKDGRVHQISAVHDNLQREYRIEVWDGFIRYLTRTLIDASTDAWDHKLIPDREFPMRTAERWTLVHLMWHAKRKTKFPRWADVRWKQALQLACPPKQSRTYPRRKKRRSTKIN